MCPITARGIEMWSPQCWDEIVGNTDLKTALQQYVLNSPVNTLVTGLKRTCKTRALLLEIQALVCHHPQEDLNPCGQCEGCQAVRSPRGEHIEIFRQGRYGFVHVDCNAVTAKELRELSMRWEFDGEKIIIYLDEVADLGKDGRDKILMKPIDEWRCTWFASATKVTKPKDRQGRPRRGEGLSGAVINRFANLLTTTLPNPEQLDGWIRRRCLDWEIEIEQEAATIQRLIERSQCRVGHVKQPIAVAASAGRVLTLERVEAFNFSPLE